ncbi:alpha tubulin suppressor [Knufia peltigerae]|uniref:Alpha tubulin suppressor n=1 Tax=Knufia peltigerae TaxID=1002370 RepID=A0AA38YA99_9EURO|nr:alpha tubulin suppressor [Knufia peltigerae]
MEETDHHDTRTTLTASSSSSPIVFALGSNGSGQLGIGHNDDSSHAQKCLFQIVDGGDDKDSNPNSKLKSGGGGVKKIVAGGNHTLLLTKDGRVFLAGNDRGGKSPKKEEEKEKDETSSKSIFREYRIDDSLDLGSSTTTTTSTTTHRTPSKETKIISDVAATWEASFFVVNRQIVYVRGTGSKGELGLGQEVCQVERPTKVFDVDDDLNDDGDDVDNTTIGVAAAAAATAAVVVAAGPVDTTTTTTKPKPKPHISTISASMSHVVFVLSDGRCFGWGSCRKGQLGENHRKDKILWRPTRIDQDSSLTFKPEGVVVGRDHTAFLSCGKRLLVWGETKDFDVHGQALSHKLTRQDTVVSGWSSIHVSSSSSSTVVSVGKNRRGQLAPTNLPPVKALAAGSEHCVAITTTQEIIAWGWGEHGNCGEEVDGKGDVAGRWNVISSPLLASDKYRVEAVAAGCATTFVICCEKKVNNQNMGK